MPVVGRITKPVLNVISALPGQIGMIGKIGSGIANILHGATSKIPNEDARKRINDVIACAMISSKRWLIGAEI